eukprot:scaffold68_cov340-Pavlova_lutheri.AAC.36
MASETPPETALVEFLFGWGRIDSGSTPPGTSKYSCVLPHRIPPSKITGEQGGGPRSTDAPPSRASPRNVPQFRKPGHGSTDCASQERWRTSPNSRPRSASKAGILASNACATPVHLVLQSSCFVGE